MLQKERERLAELQKMRDEEVLRQVAAAQEMDDMAEAKRRLKERKEEKARRRQAKEKIKASPMYRSQAKGPANGAVAVPGEYLVDVDGEKRMYWELVCDKLRATQALRDLEKATEADISDLPDALSRALSHVTKAKHRIHEAETAFQRQTAAS
ncbi:hypothetical protein NQ176_g3887 [Zarea fungicola]|uniref:Uncharacterized protein n=1 Tax=Zarea fungicola TaxID=93591 RepID=A0ACC1NHG7_9HYPO|nr:hypothetical protein NQ176_g3887 [Lecanicillium fungicola]